jgi:ubiquinone/menaquinone biosynthesis C-methylase UbiE
VQAFDERASRYEQGWLGRLHHEISDRAVRLALTCTPAPRRVLDVGSGTGYVLRRLADRLPSAVEFAGIDPAPEMVRIATASTADERLRFAGGTAERLPFDDDAFDLVISTTSFDHWTDQQRGLTECARVLVPGGRLVLTDQFSVLLWPTLAGSRRGKARTKARATRLVTRAGLHSPQWHALYAVIIQTVTATKEDRSRICGHGKSRFMGCSI